MPRKRQPSAAPPPGLPYGEGKALANSNSDIASIAPPGSQPSAGSGGPAPVPQAAQPQPLGLPDDLRLAGRAGPSPGTPLGAPTEFPNEPLTAGLASGPGPGPEALYRQPNTSLASFYEGLADVTGDPFWAELALKAR
jgi:hypothetical protein